MKIIRNGTTRDDGQTSISLDNIAGITCQNEGIRLEYLNINDFGSSNSNHNYRIFLSYDEIANIVDVLAKYTPEQKKFIGKAFEPKLKKLLRIVQACIDE